MAIVFRLCPLSSDVLLFLVKCPYEHIEFFFAFTSLFALFHFFLRDFNGALNLFTFKFRAFSAHFYSMLLCAWQKHKATDRTTAAACALYLLITQHMVTPTNLIPEQGGFVQFFLCFRQKPGADCTVVAAYRNNRLGVSKLSKSFNIPFHKNTPLFLS